ncbi:MAG: hypothetical protein H7125_05835 [Proteobacteria bacterium]|nr:hypothetical protein [Burkholderiales bacterium]
MICTTMFHGLAQGQCRALGMPDLPLFVIPHPLGGLTRDEVEQRAELAFAPLLEWIKGGAR